MVPDWSQLCSSLKYPRFLVSPDHPQSPRSLRGPYWFLTEVSGLVLNTEVLDMSRGIFVLSLMPLAAVEVSHLLGISKASSKESKRTSLAPDWSQCCRSQY